MLLFPQGGISLWECFMSNERNDTSELTASLLPAFQKEPRIAAAYLFGSRGTGNVGAQSDTDLAILVCRPRQRISPCRMS